jgi:hypothetical protein
MKRLKLKRRIASWVLLSVFVPMMVLFSLHHHSFHADLEHSCVQCEHHLPHAGHFSAQTVSHGDCVLCQFTSLQYLPFSAQVFSSILSYTIVDISWQPLFVAVVAVGHQTTRAPPTSF